MARTERAAASLGPGPTATAATADVVEEFSFVRFIFSYLSYLYFPSSFHLYDSVNFPWLPNLGNDGARFKVMMVHSDTQTPREDRIGTETHESGGNGWRCGSETGLGGSVAANPLRHDSLVAAPFAPRCPRPSIAFTQVWCCLSSDNCQKEHGERELGPTAYSEQRETLIGETMTADE